MKIEPGRVVRAGSSSRWRRLTINAAIFAVSLFVYSAPAAGALVITPTFDSSITNDANAAGIEGAINAAISAIESSVSSPHDIAVSIYFTEMNTGLGASFTTTYDVNYYDYYNQFASVATSATQLSALASLGAAPTSESAGNPVNHNASVAITSAEGRNLGFTTSGLIGGNTDISHATFNQGGTYDSEIGLNTSITYPPQSNNGSNYGLQSVATHEIDEVLGIGGTGSTLTSTSSLTGAVGDLDLYRYNGVGSRSYLNNDPNQPYLSYDGGATVVSYFNQVSGADFADWQSNPVHSGFGNQVQDAFGQPGTNPTLGPNELTALNMIGYNVTSQSGVVPEPSSLILFSVGLVGMTVFGRCRRTRFF